MIRFISSLYSDGFYINIETISTYIVLYFNGLLVEVFKLWCISFKVKIL